MCFLACCLYSFVAVAKICKLEQLSCLFQTVENQNETYEAIELKRTKDSKIWQLNERSHVLMQDSSFVVRKNFKEPVKKISQVQ